MDSKHIWNCVHKNGTPDGVGHFFIFFLSSFFNHTVVFVSTTPVVFFKRCVCTIDTVFSSFLFYFLFYL